MNTLHERWQQVEPQLRDEDRVHAFYSGACAMFDLKFEHILQKLDVLTEEVRRPAATLPAAALPSLVAALVLSQRIHKQAAETLRATGKGREARESMEAALSIARLLDALEASSAPAPPPTEMP